ncbi:MAG: DegT/DnrJ/EryC1/StrS family aminotransferase [Planctomycetota bacterium]
MTREIPLSGQDITQLEIDAVVAVLKSDRLALGPRLAEFEAEFTKRLGVKHAICCSSGTAGLHMCWRAMGLAAGDEVITTPFSFIASSNSLMFDGGRPVFVDIDPRTWQIDVGQIEAAITPRTKALLPVDIFGAAPDWDAIWTIARRHRLRVLEDSCEALGGTYNGRPCGTLGEAGVFGFYPNKQMTTGEGGMVVTDDDRIAFLCRSLRNQGRDPEGGWLAHPRLGYNYRMCDLQAALGAVQMRRLDEILAKRDQVANWYIERLRDDPRLTVQEAPAGCRISWFVFVVRLSDEYEQADRDRLLGQLRAKGIGCQVYFPPIHLQEFYQRDLGYRRGQFPITEALAARTIALPFCSNLPEGDVETVVRTLRGLL